MVHHEVASAKFHLPTFPDVVRAIRLRSRMNTRQFAQMLGVSQASVSRYEAGRVLPSKPVLQHLMTMAEGVERVTVAKVMGETLTAIENRKRKMPQLEFRQTLDKLRRRGPLMNAPDDYYRDLDLLGEMIPAPATPDLPSVSELEHGWNLSDDEKRWLQGALIVLRSSKAHLLSGLIDSLEEGVRLDELTRERRESEVQGDRDAAAG